ncbi:hypothetical protein L9F63_000454 [Diploptera punctata]|uniref:Uncharacterized protein n=1 Tax=Diploptera punctata TaxID=6984 RepID=A0AAD8ALM9_DIPPU|nr:hypothetical protein L9F63_000454 [Diploptera punctata]
MIFPDNCKYLYYLVIILISKTVVEAQCPTVCECKTEYTAKCVKANLKIFPIGFSNKLQNLDISSNFIKNIDELTIRRRYITSLKQFNISNNVLELIDKKSFFGLGKLEKIDLSWNKIKKLYPDTFKYLPNLKWLSLQGNENLFIKDNEAFLINESLQILHLQNCNLINISMKSFDGLPTLKELYLTHNFIKTIQANSEAALITLQILDLSDNSLCEIPKQIIRLPNLEQLDTANNKIHMFYGNEKCDEICQAHQEF